MNIVEELRSKKSRDNRELLDKAADRIEELEQELIKYKAKELCDCHHKCHDTSDCVVEDDALLLINQDKSNNFEVKSNNELFKQALVEGVNNHIDKTIEEENNTAQNTNNFDSRQTIEEEKQIEEIGKVLCKYYNTEECNKCGNHIWCSLEQEAQDLYNAGYRKQSEGEWNDNIIGFCNVCMNCGAIVERSAIKNNSDKLNFCPNCGAKMKGGAE